ncbi:MAG: MBL fold metallo-hydrolase, partial [Candidatus Dormibacteria bacterium]
NFPRASVVCHPKGARHLADPTRLIAASAEVYGERLDTLYGRMTPVPLDRLMAAEDGLVLELGAGRSLLLVHSPGHAKHHLGILEQSSGTLLVGDAVGVKLPGSGPLRPATPPNDFDLELAVHSLHRFRELRPTQLVLTHFGPVGEPEAVLVEAEDALQSWAAVASEAFAERPEVDHIERALRARFASSAEPPGPTQTAQDILSGFRSNAEGMFGWLRRQRESRAQVEEGGATAPQ